MNKGRQATLFQSWGKKDKTSVQKEDASITCINLCEELNEDDDDDILAEVLEQSIHEYNENNTSDRSEEQGSTETCNTSISIGTECCSQGQTQGALGFDRGAGKLWIYPTNYPVRDYQFNIVSQSLLKNTMVTLPTGLGKTFIAAVVMYNFFRWYPKGKVVFMAPTKPLVAQQIEACYNIMGIPQEDTAEMTGTIAPTERRKIWIDKRVFFLTPQVIMNDLSRGTCPANNVRCLVIDEAHKATGNHAYCQVVKELVKYTTEFRILALSATPGGDIKAVQQVIENLLISHIEIRTEESLDIKPYSHERKVEKIVVPLGDDLTNVKKKYVQIMDVTVNKLKRHGVIYKRETTSLSKFLILKAREDFRQNPPPNLQRSSYGIVEGDFALAMSLYHGFELLQLHGSRSLYNYLDGLLHGEKGYGRTRTELTRNPDFNDLMNILQEKFITHQNGGDSNKMVTGHPKMEKLEEVVVNHFNTFKSGDSETRVMIFSQYRDSVSEITNILKQHVPLVKVMSFIGQSSAGKSTKGFTQKEQLKVMKEFRDGGYNTLVSTCVGEEGLDIGDVDLIVCFDAHKSPIRLVQRMGRTGRKREGRIVMLVTEGKEEQIYNQSQYSKRSVHKAILNSAKTLHFYPNNPSMLPASWMPKCHKMFITVNKKFKPTKTVNMANQSKITSMIVNNEKTSSGDGGISKEDYSSLLEYCNGEIGRQLPRKPALLSLGESDEAFSEDTLRLSEWFLWQNRLQSSYLVDHSRQSKNFVEVVQFLELQETLDPNEDSYGQEMEMYLNETDILKPGQTDEEVCNIKQFFVQDVSSTKHGGKKKSLLSKTKRSVQLQDFDEFIISDDSGNELPKVFAGKKSSCTGDDDSTKNTTQTSPVISAKSKKKCKRRNVRGNTSIIDIIKDSDNKDFTVCHDQNQKKSKTVVIDKEEPNKSENATFQSHLPDATSPQETAMLDRSLLQGDLSDTSPQDEAVLDSSPCADFTKLLPSLFSPSVYTPPNISDKPVWQVPAAPSTDELCLLLDGIDHMITLPNIDVKQIADDCYKDFSELGTMEVQASTVQDKIELKSYSRTNKITPEKATSVNVLRNAQLEMSAILSPLNGSKSQTGGDLSCNSFEVSNASIMIDDPSEKLNITDHSTSPVIQPKKGNHIGVNPVTTQLSLKIDKTANKPIDNKPVDASDALNTKCLNAVTDKEVAEHVEMDEFSGSDEFIDTQANFMLSHMDDFADISPEGNDPNELEHQTSKSAFESESRKLDFTGAPNLTTVITESAGKDSELQDNKSNENRKEYQPKVHHHTKVVEKFHCDGSFFDDSFINTGVLEGCKTPTEKVSTEPGMSSPSQITFTQAMACVHDSESMDILEKTGLSGHSENDTVNKLSDVDEMSSSKHTNKKLDDFTVIKPHNEMTANDSQLDLINNMLSTTYSDNSCDDNDEAVMPLFDLGFAVDDDIIPPSPCLSQTNSQKSTSKSLSQSLLSSRKSLSFSNKTVTGNCTVFRDHTMSPVTEELTNDSEEINMYGEDKLTINDGNEREQDILQNRQNKLKIKDDEGRKKSILENREHRRADKDNNGNKKDILENREDKLATTCMDQNERKQDMIDNDISISDFHEDFDLIPTSPVLSGRRSAIQKPSLTAIQNKHGIVTANSETEPDYKSQSHSNFLLGRNATKNSKEMSAISDDENDFSIIKRSTVKKKTDKSVTFVDSILADMDSDFEDYMGYSHNNVDVTDKTPKKRKNPKVSSNPFLLNEADVSEDSELSSDEEEHGDDKMEDSFVSEGCTQLSQGQQEELQAIYLKSVKSPKGQLGKYKLKFDYDKDVNVFSQFVEDASEYYDDSFVCDNEEFSMLDGHEITIMDKRNILDNESYIGPRTRWSKPKPCSSKISEASKCKKRRVKYMIDSSSEDECDSQIQKLKSPINIHEPVMKNDINESQCQARTNIKKRKPILSSSEEDHSPQCKVTSRIAKSPSMLNDGTTVGIQDNTNEISFCNNQHYGKTDESAECSEDSDLLLNVNISKNNKAVVIVDSREVNGAQDIVSLLRFNQNVEVAVAQVHSCDYVVSIRMGVDRQVWSHFSNGANRAKITERIHDMCESYEKPCLIIEKDKVKGDEKGRTLHWTKYVDKTLVQLIQSKMMILFTENQTETATLIGDLCHLESRKNCAITCPVNVSSEQMNQIKFYISIPHLNYTHCLYLCNNFKSVANFLRSDVTTIMNKGKMTTERATTVYNYIRRTFDSQMLPSN